MDAFTSNIEGRVGLGADCIVPPLFERSLLLLLLLLFEAGTNPNDRSEVCCNAAVLCEF